MNPRWESKFRDVELQLEALQARLALRPDPEKEQLMFAVAALTDVVKDLATESDARA